MKILEVRFKNLNALLGEWLIDFARADYQAEGLFGIFGPTGSGKTTLLDAICLALYGSTPRLGRITKNSNEILSRQAVECYAEVLFQVGTQRYRCHWEQRRSRRTLQGNLQEPDHQLFDADTGQPIETQRRLVLQAIEQVTGMDFDRFTRSMLLAQGAFDRFLKADLEAKSKILEQITGTEIYTQISQGVYAHCQTERETLKHLLSQQEVLGSGEVFDLDALIQQIKAGRQQLTILNEHIQTLQTAQNWLQRLAQWQQELTQVRQAAELAAQAMVAWQPEYDRWQAAEKAVNLESDYSAVQTLKTQLEEERQQLVQIATQKPMILDTASRLRAVAVQTQAQLDEGLQAYQAYQPVLQAYRVLEDKIASQQQQIQKVEQEQRQVHALETSCLAEQQAVAQAQANLVQQLQTISEYQQQRSADARLVEIYSALEWQLRQWEGLQQKCNASHEQRMQLEIDASQQQRAVALAHQTFQQTQTQLQQAQQTVGNTHQAIEQLLQGRLLREIQAEKVALEQQARLEFKIAELEQERAHLQAGAPCPLCGALEHPYKVHHPTLNDTESKIKVLEQSLFAIESLKGQQEVAQQQLQQVERLQVQTYTQWQSVQQTLHQTQEKLQGNLADFKRLEHEQQVLFQEIQTHLTGIIDLKWHENFSVDAFLQQIQTRKTAWVNSEKKRQQLVEQQQVYRSDAERLQERLVGIQAQAEHLHQRMIEETQQLERLQTESIATFGASSPLVKEQELKRQLEVAQFALQQSQSESQTAQTQVVRLEEAEQSCLSRKEAAEKRLALLEPQWQERLGEQGFIDLPHFLQSRASLEQRVAWQQQYRQLHQAQLQAQTQYQERAHQLSLEQAKNLTQHDAVTLSNEQSLRQSELEQLQNQLFAQEGQYQRFLAQKEQTQKLQQQIDHQRQHVQPWEQLNSYIGSADGKKYRSFAQSITFSTVLAYANQQLTKMTDRYILMRDTEVPLSILVVDQYQAGAIRSTSNLSGGETFMVSLCLALGLAKMSSQTVQVESLFLDEGFGTLDEEALELALETLTQLQATGMLIGVISHVSALKERIRTQILVQPLFAGNSRLSGPGCQQLS